jgi:glycosyltransferase involved in cell wall biosynthesis
MLRLVNIMTKSILIIASYAGIPRVKKFADAAAKGSNAVIFEWDRSAKLPKRELANKIETLRLGLRAPIGKFLIFWYPLWAAHLALFFLRREFNVVIPQNLECLAPIWLIAKLRRTKIIYDIADFYSDTNIPASMQFLRKIIASTERFFIERVNATIIVDDSRFEQLAEIPREKVIVVYNSPEDHYEELDIASASKKRSDDTFRLFYGGVISADRNLFTLADVADGMSNVKLIVAGFGAKEAEFRDYISNKKNIEFIGRVDHSKIIELTYESDCIVALYDPRVPNNLLASPNKLFEAMMCAKPVIVSSRTSMSAIVRNEQCGIIVDYDDVNAIQRAVQTLKDDKELTSTYGRNARKAYVEKYNWQTMEERLTALIDRLSHGR